MSVVHAEDDEALHLNTFSVAIGVAVVHSLSGIALLVNNGGLRTPPLFFRRPSFTTTPFRWRGFLLAPRYWQ